MTALPVWLTGPGGSYAVSITPQTVAANGTLTPGSTSSLTASIDKVTVSYKPVTEEISAMTAGRTNTVKLQSATQISLTEILKSNGTNILAGLIAANDYYVVVITRGPNTWTFTGLCTGYDEDLVRGKSTGTATFEMVDPSTANPTYA